MRRNQKDGLVWYTFPIFDGRPELRHGVFTRFGGVSGPSGDELRMSFNDFDHPDNVRTNIRRAEAALNVGPSAYVRQTHSSNIAVIRPEDDYRPAGPEDSREDFDALLAPAPGPTLLIKVADCQALILYDPRTKALALVHSGWRGSVSNIIGAAVARMADFGVRPADLLAAVAPSLGPCCAEFVNYREELPESFWPFRVSENHFDFWAISRQQLADSGVRPENVAVAGVCTKCSGEFFSYRGGDRWPRFGVMAAVTGENHE